MTCRLTIGMLGAHFGWSTVLGQCGLPFEEIRNVQTIAPEQYSVIVVARPLGRAAAAVVADYVRAGGSALDCGNFLGMLGEEGVKRTRTRSIVPDDGDELLASIGLIDLFAPTRRYRGSNHLKGLVHIERQGRGWLCFLGLDVDALCLDRRNARKRFHVPSGMFPSEIVSLVSRGEARALVELLLKRLHLARGLPYLHKWFFPEERKNVFCYRIDSDYGSREQVAELDRIAERWGAPMTWFLHVQAHEEWLAMFRSFRHQEIAIHCYAHKTFLTYEANHANIAEAKFLLEREGFDCRGFAAPNGIWNEAIGRAVRDHGFLYSSEFSFDYDNLPSFPMLQGRVSPVLQIPIHPVSVGNFLRVRGSEREMIEYYRATIHNKSARNQPLIFYHHPTHEAWDVVEATIASALDSGAAAMSFAEYAAWWVARDSLRYEAWHESGSLRIIGAGDPSVRLRVERESGEYGYVENVGDISLDAVRWHSPQSPGESRPHDLERIRRFSFKAMCHSIEDINTRMRQ